MVQLPASDPSAEESRRLEQGAALLTVPDGNVKVSAADCVSAQAMVKALLRE